MTIDTAANLVCRAVLSPYCCSRVFSQLVGLTDVADLSSTRSNMERGQEQQQQEEEGEVAAMIESVKRDGGHLSLACRPFGRIPGTFIN